MFYIEKLAELSYQSRCIFCDMMLSRPTIPVFLFREEVNKGKSGAQMP